VAPRLRNLVLAKCRNITDIAVNAISKLGKNLHYVHLGHCNHITDEAVIKLVQCCNRIRYIDLGCCVKLTDASVTKLATLPKLRRIGLVKCNMITDESVYALSQSHRRYIQGGAGQPELAYAGLISTNASSLERVHLSYCTNLTLRVRILYLPISENTNRDQSIIVLLNNCPRLTHLSLTGVHAFLRTDLDAFCRDAPSGVYPPNLHVAIALTDLYLTQNLLRTNVKSSASFQAKVSPASGATSTNKQAFVVGLSSMTTK